MLALITSLILDLAIIWVPDAPIWFCIMFGSVNFIAASWIVEMMESYD